MAQPAYIQKTLRMKPEVEKIFEDLEKWHDHCRFNLLPFVPSDLYRSRDYKDWARYNSGERKPYYRKDRPQRSE